jgi:hypothetical protein
MLAGGAAVVGVGSGLISHATFLKGYLDSKGADPVDFSEFETLQGSTATGAENIGRLTKLQHLNVDTRFVRYRSAKNPAFGATFPQAINITNRTAIPITMLISTMPITFR